MAFDLWNGLLPADSTCRAPNIRSLLAGRDGTLWIGTLEGLASWKDGKLKEYVEIPKQNVLALLEDNEGTVWAGIFAVPKGQFCSIRSGDVQCFGNDGSLGQWVSSLFEDEHGHLWAGTETGLWLWRRGSEALRDATPD